LCCCHPKPACELKRTADVCPVVVDPLEQAIEFQESCKQPHGRGRKPRQHFTLHLGHPHIELMTKGRRFIQADIALVGGPMLQPFGESRRQRRRVAVQTHALQERGHWRMVLGQFQQRLRQRLRMLGGQESDQFLPFVEAMHTPILNSPGVASPCLPITMANDQRGQHA